SPRCTVSDTSSTAWTTALPLAKTPCFTGKCLVRFRSSTSGPSPGASTAGSAKLIGQPPVARSSASARARPAPPLSRLRRAHLSCRRPDLRRDLRAPDLALALGAEQARVEVTVRHRLERRQLLVAGLEAVLAARVERTPARRMQERRWRPLDR